MPDDRRAAASGRTNERFGGRHRIEPSDMARSTAREAQQ
jgi:hypothetical protein